MSSRTGSSPCSARSSTRSSPTPPASRSTSGIPRRWIGGLPARRARAEDQAVTIKGKAYIAGIYEHPTRKADDTSLAQLHAEVARGALEDAGLTKADVDGYFCAGDAPGLGGLAMADYMGLRLRHIDTTETGGSSYVVHVAHA